MRTTKPSGNYNRKAGTIALNYINHVTVYPASISPGHAIKLPVKL
jgi:hypothetical protein